MKISNVLKEIASQAIYSSCVPQLQLEQKGAPAITMKTETLIPSTNLANSP